jgi:hypothetical protein
VADVGHGDDPVFGVQAKQDAVNARLAAAEKLATRLAAAAFGSAGATLGKLAEGFDGAFQSVEPPRRGLRFIGVNREKQEPQVAVGAVRQINAVCPRR